MGMQNSNNGTSKKGNIVGMQNSSSGALKEREYSGNAELE